MKKIFEYTNSKRYFLIGSQLFQIFSPTKRILFDLPSLVMWLWSYFIPIRSALILFQSELHAFDL